MKVNRDGKCKSVMLFFLSQLLISRIYAVDSKLLNLEEVSLRGILFCIICLFGRDIDRQKFCKYGWDNLFQKSSIVKRV